MNNKKGFTLVELIVSFALITAVSLAFFKTILVLQQEQLKNIARNSYKAFTVVLNNSIQKDFLNDNIEKIISCGENCYDITYTTNGIVRLSIDKENNTITYGNIKEKLPKDYKFINNIEFTSYINSYEGNDSYVALNLNIKSSYEKNIENIKYVYQYDSDNGIIELNVDGANATDIIEYLLYKSPNENGLYEPLLPDGTSTGIRYRGSNPNNYVYFNCDDEDSSNVSYREDGYDYANSCEVWRIIGVFDVDNGKGNVEKRIKLINTASTFSASWDSSASDVNGGYGINEWGSSDDYEGADLMQLLNGYYIGIDSAECVYCNDIKQGSCTQVCDTESNTLKSNNMKKLSINALNMIENSKWFTNAIHYNRMPITIENSSVAYIQEIQNKDLYTGRICKSTHDTHGSFCNDKIIRKDSWIGLIGLMYISDVGYANGWLYSSDMHAWAITPGADDLIAYRVWHNNESFASTTSARTVKEVWPSLYLKSNVTFEGVGNGTEESPYILGIKE